MLGFGIIIINVSVVLTVTYGMIKPMITLSRSKVDNKCKDVLYFPVAILLV
jgi:hypothetical protein